MTKAKEKLTSANSEARLLTIAAPDASQLPYDFYADELNKQQLHVYTMALEELLKIFYPTSVLRVDFRPLLKDFDYYAEPQRYGFGPLGKYGSCLVGAYGETPNVTLCEDVQPYVYWDEYQ